MRHALGDGDSRMTGGWFLCTELDVAKVISMDSVPDTCGVVPVQMTYEDHQGQRHKIGRAHV